jgi:hypothetical protein
MEEGVVLAVKPDNSYTHVYRYFRLWLSAQYAAGVAWPNQKGPW